jgi:hypothetical protein
MINIDFLILIWVLLGSLPLVLVVGRVVLAFIERRPSLLILFVIFFFISYKPYMARLIAYSASSTTSKLSFLLTALKTNVTRVMLTRPSPPNAFAYSLYSTVNFIAY